MKRNVNISIKTIVWIIGVIGLAVLSISAINLKKDGPIRNIVVDVIQFDGGDYFLTEEDVREEVLVVTGPLDNKSLADINPAIIEQSLKFNPFIQHADVFVSSTGEIMVTIRQRKPILRVFDKSGESYYIDRQGTLIPVSPYFTARVIVANGNIPAHNADDVEGDEQLQALHRLVTTIDEDTFLKSLIEQIYIQSDRSVILVPKISDIRIEFGAIVRIAEKLENLKVFFTEVLQQEGWSKYESISLEYRGQIVCKKRQS